MSRIANIDGNILYEWLGIPPDQQPPNHYCLLGIQLFETSDEVIRNAADKQYGHVKRLAVNEFADAGQALLNSIMTAKLCLLNPERRAVYDAELRQSLQRSPLAAASPPTAAASTYPDSQSHPHPHPNTDQTRDPSISIRDSLLIGADASCDLVIAHPLVSSLHCRVSKTGDGLRINDLGSTNGVYVNLRRVQRSILKPCDVVTLGRDVRLRLPNEFLPPAFRTARLRLIGRSSECDVWVDHPNVSKFHAKIYRSGGATMLEDLGSTNGTQVVFNGAARSATGPVVLDGATEILLGDQRLAVQSLDVAGK